MKITIIYFMHYGSGVDGLKQQIVINVLEVNVLPNVNVVNNNAQE